MEKNSNKKIHIIGAGISGLVAAIQLEKKGYEPIILEKDSTVGGRVQTDIINGYQLDRGFQVLLEAYPKAKEYLDYQALELQPLYEGAILFQEGKKTAFGDPLRNSHFLFPILSSKDASLKDKIKTYQLKKKLAKTSIDDIFKKEETTTLNYLQRQGFSERIIESFFRPFFSGIYLEPNLETSSRMFEFVYKMFGEGRAMIPKKGMVAIPEQLLSQLKKTKIRFHCEVEKVNTTVIRMKGGEEIPSDFTIIATNPEKILPNYVSSLSWKRCDTLYFTVPKRNIQQAIIGLNKHPKCLVNNIFYSTSIETSSQGHEELLSITIVKQHEYTLEELISESIKELESVFDIKNLTFLKHYPIPHALPSIKNIQCNIEPTATLITEGIAIAGDHQLNASLHAAMASGEAAALMAHQHLSGTKSII